MSSPVPSERPASLVEASSSSSRKVRPTREAVPPFPDPDKLQRTYEQITRSPSRSVTPQPRIKRRRISTSQRHSRNASPIPSFGSSQSTPDRTNLSPSLELQSPVLSADTVLTTAQPLHVIVPSVSPARYIGDGLDYRQPIRYDNFMPQITETIDLTVDDDIPPSPEQIQSPSDTTRFTIQLPPLRPLTRGPSQNRTQHRTQVDRQTQTNNRNRVSHRAGNGIDQAIELASSDEDEDVQIVAERQIMRPRSLDRRSERRLPTPPLRRSNAQSFADALLNGATSMISNGRTAIQRLMPHLPRFDNDPGYDSDGLVPGPLDLEIYDGSEAELDEYGDLQMDYGAPAFNLAEMPGLNRPYGLVASEAEYKAPGDPQRGYTRRLPEHEDCVVCPACGDELGNSENEVKAQVWIGKKCGHVYCGTCAAQRINAAKLSRSKKAKRPPNEQSMATCRVDGCGAKIGAKGGMLQIYY